jgi:hypothetical protein
MASVNTDEHPSTMASVNTDEHPSTIPLHSESPHPFERDDTNYGPQNDEGSRGAVNGFTNGIVVLSFVTVVTYLIN